jgi:NAD(P)-dependent dehydrogenase (short-subunit alcohol dehydrogenase family)
MYGCGERTDSAIARGFAARGARFVLTGRDTAPVERLAREVTAAGGTATTARIDPRDPAAVDRHLASVLRPAGRVDVCCSFVATPARISSVPVMAPGSSRPTYVPPYLVPARLAANRMIASGFGTILLVSEEVEGDSGAGDPARAIRRALVRDLAAECEPHGVVVADLPAPVTPDAAASWWPVTRDALRA